jgi:hypothetical protein
LIQRRKQHYIPAIERYQELLDKFVMFINIDWFSVDETGNTGHHDLLKKKMMMILVD